MSDFGHSIKLDVVLCDSGSKVKITSKKLIPHFDLFYRTPLLISFSDLLKKSIQIQVIDESASTSSTMEQEDP